MTFLNNVESFVHISSILTSQTCGLNLRENKEKKSQQNMYHKWVLQSKNYKHNEYQNMHQQRMKMDNNVYLDNDGPSHTSSVTIISVNTAHL